MLRLPSRRSGARWERPGRLVCRTLSSWLLLLQETVALSGAWPASSSSLLRRLVILGAETGSQKKAPSQTSPTLPVIPDGREGPFNLRSLRGVMVSHSCFFSEEKAKRVEIERNPSGSLVEAIIT